MTEVRLDLLHAVVRSTVVTVQDIYASPSEPTPGMVANLYGLRDLTVQYWTGRAGNQYPAGWCGGNMLVLRTLTFAPMTTTRIRVLAEGSADSWSRVVEVEAYQVS